MTNDGPKKRKVPPFPKWLQWERRRRYAGFAFRPRVSYREGNIPPLPEGEIYDPWQGYGYKPREGGWGPLEYHLREVICAGVPERFEYLMDALAAKVQNPALPGLPVLALFSREEGTGKNTIVETILLPLFGVHAIIVDRPDLLTGRFNEHLAMAVFVYLNEAVWGGDKQRAGAYKTLFADEYRALEKKFKDAMLVKNYAFGIAASNEPWIAPMGMTDRRHAIFEVSPKHAQDSEYFSKLRRHIVHEGGREAFLHALLTRDVDFDALRKPPSWESEAKLDNVQRSLDPTFRFVFEMLASGEAAFDTGVALVEPIADDVEPLDEVLCRDPMTTASQKRRDRRRFWRERWRFQPVTYRKHEIYAAFLEFCKTRGIHHFPVESIFFRELNSVTGLVTSTRPTVHGDRERCVEFPPLSEARAKWSGFAKGMGTIEWDEDEQNLPACSR